jgi:imidazolonepropionase-like amidohydrolase
VRDFPSNAEASPKFLWRSYAGLVLASSTILRIPKLPFGEQTMFTIASVRRHGWVDLLAITAWAVPVCLLAQNASNGVPTDIVIRDATVMTVTHGTIPHGSVWIHNGKIAGVGAKVNAPAGARMIDASGKFVTPGIVDPHSHSALGNDINEATSPVTPSMMMIDAFDNRDKALYQALAGGVTTELLLHGSANMIGGQAVVIKNKFGLSRDEMLFPNAPRSIKFASGENPKRVYGRRGEVPSTRMGNFEVMRQAFEDAKAYMASWDAYNAKVAKGDKDATPPKRDLKLEALADVLRGKLYVQIHCYRADEFLTEEAIAKEYGYKIRGFHHALEMYKVGDKIAPTGTGIATFADWWGFKDEAWDAIPWNAVMSMREGVRVALKSDSNDYVRRLNQEAGKMVNYGGATEEEALRMITLNAAWIIGVDDRVGSLDEGKDGDIVIWNMDPLSTYARVEKVFIDGDLFFDSSLPGFGATHFSGVMHDAGGDSGEDEEGDGQ